MPPTLDPATDEDRERTPDAGEILGDRRGSEWLSPRVRWLIGAVLLGTVALLIDWNAMADAFRHCRIDLVVAAFASLGLSVPISVFKWSSVLRVHDERVPTRELARAAFVATFVNQVLPTGIGGDVHRITDSARYCKSLAVAALSVMEERALGIFASVVVGFGAAILEFTISGLEFARAMAITFGTFTVAGLVGSLVALRSRTRWRWKREGRLRRVLDQMRAHVGDYERNVAPLVVAFGGSVLFHLNRAFHFWLLCRALGSDVGYAEVAIATAVVNFAILIPISLGGLGTAEASFVGVTRPFGVAPAVAFAASILVRALLVPSILIGAWLFARGRLPAHGAADAES